MSDREKTLLASMTKWRADHRMDYFESFDGHDLSPAEKALVAEATSYERRCRAFRISWLLKQTGSPIERTFAAALAVVLSQHQAVVEFAGADGALYKFSDHVGVEWWKVYPQRKIGTYTADFLVEYSTVSYWDSRTTVSMVIECDGHDFHERTKEQASHDKRRDRFMQGLGHLVFRFPGSDIHRDAFACAESCVVALDAAAERAIDVLDAPKKALRG